MIVSQHFGPVKIDTCFVKNLKRFIDKVWHYKNKKVWMYHTDIIYIYVYKKLFSPKLWQQKIPTGPVKTKMYID
jgi:hypothetical protein